MKFKIGRELAPSIYKYCNKETTAAQAYPEDRSGGHGLFCCAENAYLHFSTRTEEFLQRPWVRSEAGIPKFPSQGYNEIKKLLERVAQIVMEQQLGYFINLCNR